MTVSILITWDVDPDWWLPRERRQWAVQTAMQICHAHGIPATFFVTAQPAALYQSLYPQLRQQGHELGCHGLTHGSEENYDTMSAAKQRLYLTLSRHYLQAMSGQAVRVFRSPRVKTSATTQRLLSELGYLADSTVCSQRMDVISSNLINTGWLTAPRRPYHPHAENPYRAGELPLWQIPVSATGLPFISSLLQVIGLAPMKLFFQQLYGEAQQTGKPIVYLAHPAEFIGPDRKTKARTFLKAKYFNPAYIRAHGFQARRLLDSRFSPPEFLRLTEQFLGYMASFKDVRFVTLSDYVQQLNDKG